MSTNNRGNRRNNRRVPLPSNCNDFLKAELAPMKVVNGKKVPAVNINFTKEHAQKKMTEAVFKNLVFFKNLIPLDEIQTDDDVKRACAVLYFYIHFTQQNIKEDELMEGQKELDSHINTLLEEILGITEPTAEEVAAFQVEIDKYKKANSLGNTPKNGEAVAKTLDEEFAQSSVDIPVGSSKNNTSTSNTNAAPMSPDEIVAIARDLSVLIAKCKFENSNTLEINEATYNEIAHSFATHNMPFPYAWEQFSAIWPNKNKLFVLEGTRVNTNSANTSAEKVEVLTRVVVRDFSRVVYAVFTAVIFLSSLQNLPDFENSLGRATIVLHLMLENLDTLYDGTPDKIQKIMTSAQQIANFTGDPTRLLEAYIGGDMEALVAIADGMPELENPEMGGGGLQEGGVRNPIKVLAAIAALVASNMPQTEAISIPSWENVKGFMPWSSSSGNTTNTGTPALDAASAEAAADSVSAGAIAAQFNTSQNPLSMNPGGGLNFTNYTTSVYETSTSTSMIYPVNQYSFYTSWNASPSPAATASPMATPYPMATAYPVANAPQASWSPMPTPGAPRNIMATPSPGAVNTTGSLTPRESLAVSMARRAENTQVAAQYNRSVRGNFAGVVPVLSVRSLGLVAHDAVKTKLNPEALEFYGSLMSKNVVACGPACSSSSLVSWGSAPVTFRPLLTVDERTKSIEFRRLTDVEIDKLREKYPQFVATAQGLSSEAVFTSLLPTSDRTVVWEFGGVAAAMKRTEGNTVEEPRTKQIVTEALNDIGREGPTFELGNIKLVFDATEGKKPVMADESTVGSYVRGAVNSVKSWMTVLDDPSAKDVNLPQLQGWAVEFYRKNPNGGSEYAFSTWIPAREWRYLSPLSARFIATQYPQYLDAVANFVSDASILNIRTAGLTSKNRPTLRNVAGSLIQYLSTESRYRKGELVDTILHSLDTTVESVVPYTTHPNEQIKQMAIAYVSGAQVVQQKFAVATKGRVGETAVVDTQETLKAYMMLGANITEEQANLASQVIVRAAWEGAVSAAQPALKVARALNNTAQSLGNAAIIIGTGTSSGITNTAELFANFMILAPKLIVLVIALKLGAEFIPKVLPNENEGAFGSIMTMINDAGGILKFLGTAVVGTIPAALGGATACLALATMKHETIYGYQNYFTGMYLAGYIMMRWGGKLSQKAMNALVAIRRICGRETANERLAREVREQQEMANLLEQQEAARRRIAAARGAAAAQGGPGAAQGGPAAAQGGPAAAVTGGRRHRKRHTTRKSRKPKGHKKAHRRTHKR